jgi:hypothetical protein
VHGQVAAWGVAEEDCVLRQRVGSPAAGAHRVALALCAAPLLGPQRRSPQLVAARHRPHAPLEPPRARVLGARAQLGVATHGAEQRPEPPGALLLEGGERGAAREDLGLDLVAPSGALEGSERRRERGRNRELGAALARQQAAQVRRPKGCEAQMERPQERRRECSAAAAGAVPGAIPRLERREASAPHKE